MNELDPVQKSEHNRQQLRYFRRTYKKTMVPADTPYLQRQIGEVIRFGGISKDDRLLEIGCGMGRYTLLFAKGGYRIEGLDLVPELLRELEAFNGGRFSIPLHCHDLEERPSSLRAKFDVVLTLFTLHHLYNLSAALEAMRFYLRPGGRIIALEPNPFFPFYYLQMLLTPGMTFSGEKGILNMTRRKIFSAAKEARFGKMEGFRFGALPPFLANMDAGPALERWIERIPGIKRLLAFQIFRMDLPD